jgi:hypothetical protein
MAATEIYLGHVDGYACNRNNFFPYRRASDMRWVFMPWGIDQRMQNDLDPFYGYGRMNVEAAAPAGTRAQSDRPSTRPCAPRATRSWVFSECFSPADPTWTLPMVRRALPQVVISMIGSMIGACPLGRRRVSPRSPPSGPSAIGASYSEQSS